jgi:hypothetical protein
MHICKDCTVEIQHPYIENTLTAFAVKKKDPHFITQFNRVFCVSCNDVGGIYFRLGSFIDSVFCEKCDVLIPVSYFVDAKVNAMRTKIMEDVYNHAFKVQRAY